MSMPRRTCCLLPRWSPGTAPGKTSISGCCSGEARSCARWEWRRAHCHASPVTRPKRPASGNWGLSPGDSLPVAVGSGAPSPPLPFFCRHSESRLIIYMSRSRAKVHNSAAWAENFLSSFPAFIILSEWLSAHRLKWLDYMLLKKCPEYVTFLRKKDSPSRLKRFSKHQFKNMFA